MKLRYKIIMFLMLLIFCVGSVCAVEPDNIITINNVSVINGSSDLTDTVNNTVLKGQIIEMSLQNEIIRVKVDVGGVVLCSDITVSAEKELNLNIGTEVYVGFKAMSVATLKL